MEYDLEDNALFSDLFRFANFKFAMIRTNSCTHKL